jgi:hypothetical protein
MMLCLTAILNMQAQFTWRRTFGGYGSDRSSSVRELLSGGFIVAGSTGSFGQGGGDAYVMKLAPDGSVIWSRTFGDAGVESGVSCRELADGFVIGGTTSTGDHGGYDLFLIRTDIDGNVLWERTYGGADWDICSDMEVVSDGFILSGTTYGSGSGDAFIVKTDLSGDTLWTRAVGGTFLDEALGVCALQDGGYLISGYTRIDEDGANTDAMAFKLAFDGSPLWTHLYSSDSLEYFHDAFETSGGDIICSGSTRSASPHWQIVLERIDATGSFIWRQFYGSVDDFEGREIVGRINGGFAVTGYLSAFSAGGKDMYLLLTDDQGNFILGKNYGGLGDEEGFSVDATFDGGYISAGITESYGPGIQAVYVVLGDSVGETDDDTVIEFLDPLPVPDLTSSSEQGQLWPSALSPGDPLHLRLNVPPGNAKAQVFDLRGTVVATFPVQQQETTTHLPDLAPGHYSLVVADGGGLTFRSRFIVVQ